MRKLVRYPWEQVANSYRKLPIISDLGRQDDKGHYDS